MRHRLNTDALRFDNGALPVWATASGEGSPARLTGPFGACWCTAITPCWRLS